MVGDSLETQFKRQLRITRRKTWFWVVFFVVLGVGGRLAYLQWGLGG